MQCEPTTSDSRTATVPWTHIPLLSGEEKDTVCEGQQRGMEATNIDMK